MSSFLKEIRIAARSLTRRPLLTIVAVLSLGLGIGANSAIFSMVNGILLRPLPGLDAPSELARVYVTNRDVVYASSVSYLDFEDYQRMQGGVFDAMAAYTPAVFSLRHGDGVAARGGEVVWGSLVSGGYFSTLGVKPAFGRFFDAAEVASEGTAPVAVISYELWRERFGEDPGIVGQTVQLNSLPFTVVGIAPRKFIGTEVLFQNQIWVPLTMAMQVAPEQAAAMDLRGVRFLRVTGRLAEATTLAQAQARMETVGQQLEAEYPEDNKKTQVVVIPESEARLEVGLDGPLKFASTMLLALVGLVLLIACANVANLLLARAAGRRREIGVRLALGAKRWQLVRQLLTESWLLALAGGVVGLLIAFWTSHLLSVWELPTNLPLDLDVPLDLRVTFFTLIAAVLAGLIFGLVPALQASRPQLVPALKDGGSGRGATGGRRKLSMGHLLVGVQVAFSLVLLVSSVLFLQSLRNAQAADIGLNAENLLAVTFDTSLSGLEEDAGRQFQRQVRERAEALPGVEAVTLAMPLPMDWMARMISVTPAEAADDDSEVDVFYSAVEPGYFETVGTRLLQGRAFDERDDEAAPQVVIVNAALADRLWPGEDALGQQLRSGFGSTSMEVVGVAQTGKVRLVSEPATPFLYVPLRQQFSSQVTLALRTSGPPARLDPAVRAELAALDPDLAIYDVRPFDEVVSGRALTPIRLVALLAGAFGLLGLILAAAGLYAVMAYAVASKTREIGLRIALGASTASVLWRVLGQGLKLTGFGLAFGVGLAWLLGRGLGSLLVGLEGASPLVLVGVAVALLVVSVLASLLPARRAARVDPMVALRDE